MAARNTASTYGWPAQWLHWLIAGLVVVQIVLANLVERADAPLRADSPRAKFGGEVEAEYRDHLYFQFAAGGFDITRNVIARRGLGLPR